MGQLFLGFGLGAYACKPASISFRIASLSVLIRCSNLKSSIACAISFGIVTTLRVVVSEFIAMPSRIRRGEPPTQVVAVIHCSLLRH